MYVVKMCANCGATKHLKFATTFDTRRKAEEVAERWLRSDVSFKVADFENEYMLNKNERKRG